MKIRIEPNTLANNKLHSVFDILMLMVEAGRHTFDIDYLEDLFDSNWYKELDYSSREIIRQSSQAGSFQEASINPVVVVDQNACMGGVVDFPNRITRVQPFDALQFLMQPFSVIVENEWFDGGFLLWMAKALNIQSFSVAYRRHRFQFRNAGGKGSLARSAQVMSEGVWPRRDGSSSRALRLWSGILLDSDAEYPGHDPNDVIRSACAPNSAWVRQLSHRSIENFVPKENMLKLLPSGGNRARVHAYFRMSDEQRKHYHMKRGFGFQRNVRPTKAEYLASGEVPVQAKNLYRTITDADWALLAPGFGGVLSKIYVEEAERPNPGRVALQSRSVESEMREILELIMRSI